MDIAVGFLFLVCLVEIGFHAYERNEWSKERKELTQRIQSPETAVASYARGQTDPPRSIAPIALDDDEAFEKLRLEREGLAGDQ